MRNEVKEYVVCAAIWYKELETPIYNPVNVDQGLVICGHRHAHCIAVMSSFGRLRTVTNGPRSVGEHIQGFLTSRNRFVDRQEAREIAKERGQIKDDHIGGDLFSEDIY